MVEGQDILVRIPRNIVGPMAHVLIAVRNATIKKRVTRTMQPLQIRWEAARHIVEPLITDGVGLMKKMVIVNGNK